MIALLTRDAGEERNTRATFYETPCRLVNRFVAASLLQSPDCIPGPELHELEFAVFPHTPAASRIDVGGAA
jgi:hypothetical protein